MCGGARNGRETARRFISKDTGVLFKIKIASGTVVSAYVCSGTRVGVGGWVGGWVVVKWRQPCGTVVRLQLAGRLALTPRPPHEPRALERCVCGFPTDSKSYVRTRVVPLIVSHFAPACMMYHSYSHIPVENEVLLSPNMRFIVAREMYVSASAAGWACLRG